MKLSPAQQLRALAPRKADVPLALVLMLQRLEGWHAAELLYREVHGWWPGPLGNPLAWDCFQCWKTILEPEVFLDE